MEGYSYLKAGECIDMASQLSGHITLLAKKGDFEVMEQTVLKGKEIGVIPGDSDDLFEFFYILDGELYDEDEAITFTKGDIIMVGGIKAPKYFKVREHTRALYVVNQSVFMYISDGIKSLREKIELVEGKDLYTKDHSNRVMELALGLGESSGRKDYDKMKLAFAGLFHDLGKINIPTEILTKPGRLTEEEFEIIKKHSEYGKMLSCDFGLAEIGEIIEQHHERIDGSGYPNGIKGDEICLEARIIAIVDTYDAMTSDRSYRPARSKEDAYQVLREGAGTVYDGDLVDAFIQHLEAIEN